MGPHDLATEPNGKAICTESGPVAETGCEKVYKNCHKNTCEKRETPANTMTTRRRRGAAVRSGLAVPAAELDVLHDCLVTSSTNTKNRAGMATKLHHFIAHFYAVSNRPDYLILKDDEVDVDWSEAARSAFCLLPAIQQKKITSVFDINYAKFLAAAPENKQPMEDYFKFLLSRRRASLLEGGDDIPLAAKSMGSFNTAFTNGIWGAGLEKTVPFERARQKLMKKITSNEQKLRAAGAIKAHVGSDVFPLHLHDYLCEYLFKLGTANSIKLLLVMLMAFKCVSACLMFFVDAAN